MHVGLRLAMRRMTRIRLGVQRNVRSRFYANQPPTSESSPMSSIEKLNARCTVLRLNPVQCEASII